MEEKLTFKELDKDVQSKYLTQLLICLGFILFCIILAFTTRLAKEFLILGSIGVIYLLYTLFDIWDLLKNNNIFIFTGTIRQIDKPVYDMKIKKYYGEAKIIIETNGTQCQVPISQTFNGSENDNVTVICKKRDMYFQEPFFIVTKALVTRVEKYN